jgi:hypothetical protein
LALASAAAAARRWLRGQPCGMARGNAYVHVCNRLPVVTMREVRKRLERKGLMVAGMWLDAVGIVVVSVGNDVLIWASAVLLLGLGRALPFDLARRAVCDWCDLGPYICTG